MSEISGTKQRLLIVDDSKVIRVTARKILQNHFETVEAVDGDNAWEILNSQEPFSLVVSDLTMPNLDGFGLLERIRSSHLPHLSNIPVIIITGANDSEITMQRATAAGATDFIGKPFDSVHLLTRTQAHASSYAANNTLTEENILLEDRAQMDPLTGLVSDTAFMEQGCQQLAYTIRHNTGLALASLEIDDFGELVKHHGKDAGELAIKSVGSVLATNIRKEDVAARTGTARFALLLPGMDNTGISNLANRISEDIGKRAVIIGGKRVQYTVSIGIGAPGIQPDTGFDKLLAIADNSLKRAVAMGGNQIVLDGSGDGEAIPDPEVTGFELTLEPPEKADFSVAELEDIQSGSEVLQIRTQDPFSDLYAEPDTDTATVLADRDQEIDALESAETSQFDTALTLETTEDEVEETIIITSPYSLYELDELDELEITDTTAESDMTPAADSQAQATSQLQQSGARAGAAMSIDADEQDEALDIETSQARPGLLRRILSALFGVRK